MRKIYISTFWFYFINKTYIWVHLIFNFIGWFRYFHELVIQYLKFAISFFGSFSSNTMRIFPHKIDRLLNFYMGRFGFALSCIAHLYHSLLEAYAHANLLNIFLPRLKLKLNPVLGTGAGVSIEGVFSISSKSLSNALS